MLQAWSPSRNREPTCNPGNLHDHHDRNLHPKRDNAVTWADNSGRRARTFQYTRPTLAYELGKRRNDTQIRIAGFTTSLDRTSFGACERAEYYLYHRFGKLTQDPTGGPDQGPLTLNTPTLITPVKVSERLRGLHY